MKRALVYPLLASLIFLSFSAFAKQPTRNAPSSSNLNQSCVTRVCGPDQLRSNMRQVYDKTMIQDAKSQGADRCVSAKCGAPIPRTTLTLPPLRGACLSRVCGPPVSSN